MENRNLKKIKRKIRFARVISFVFLLVGMLYITYIGPFLNFMKNQMPDDSSDMDPVLSRGEDVIDPVGYETPVIVKTPEPTLEPGETPGPTKVPVPTTTIKYVPDPKVPGVKQIKGKDLRLESDAVNILLLGVDEKYNNVDSIFIASFSESKKTVKLVSIPRDTYVPYPANISKVIKSPRYYFTGVFKINASCYVGNLINYQDGIFSNKGINFLSSVIKGLLPNANITIDEYVRVNFEGFTELVDIFGGVYIDVPENIYSSTGKLMFAKGRQYVNSKQALEFVRVRHRYDSDGTHLSSTGDPYRKANQLAFLSGCAQQLITLESVNKAPQILESLSKNVYHSFNTFSKVSRYSSIAKDYALGNYKMEMLLIVGKSIDPLGDKASYVDIRY